MSARYNKICDECETKFNTKVPAETRCVECRKEFESEEKLKQLIVEGDYDSFDPDELDSELSEGVSRILQMNGIMWSD